MIKILLDIIGTAFLIAPLVWEIDNDKNGDIGKNKRVDVIIRGFLAVCSAYINFLFGNPFWFSLLFSGVIHFSLFDYIIAYKLSKNKVILGHWFTYLGGGWFDNLRWWIKAGPYGRLGIKLLVFVIAASLYFNNL